uniref:Uncharacterized protein n=1 Tax=Kalanchoe fedtschenkoi TaxID=63787 RepID=A0A7N0VA55_KALFE
MYPTMVMALILLHCSSCSNFHVHKELRFPVSVFPYNNCSSEVMLVLLFCFQLLSEIIG